MALFAVPGGIIRGTLLGAPPESSIAVVRSWLLSRAKPTREGSLATPAKEPEPGDASPPPESTGPSATEPPPPLPIVVVHRSREGSSPITPPRGRRRPAFGDDLLDEDQPPRTLRRVIDRLMRDIADKRDDDRDGDRS
jgi:hypothetical protein